MISNLMIITLVSMLLVAVISYTGYDMEDAMVINKSSYENGLGHGVVYKTVEYQLTKDDTQQQ
jgi:DNA-directed RNA polymerase beta subunit